MFDKSKFTVVKQDNVAVLKYDDKKVYESNAPVDLDVLKSVAEYNKKYITEATELAKDKSVELFKEKGSKIDKVTVEYPYGYPRVGTADIIVEKAHKFTNNFGKDKSDSVIVKPYVKVAVEDKSVHLSKDYLRKLSADIEEALQK